MLVIAICEDEKAERDLLGQWISEWSMHSAMKVNILVFENSEQFLFYWQERKDIDLLFLDIEMGKLDGMSLARMIRKTDTTLPIVFTTGLAEYMVEGYDVAALHYLLKPIDKERLFNCLDKVAQKEEAHAELILLETIEGAMIRIDCHEIWYIEASGHYCELCTKQNKVEIKLGMSEIEKIEALHFLVKIHRSYLVNMQYVAKIEKNQLQLDDGQYLPVSRRAIKHVTEAFVTYYGR